jgi:hypothetical protein
VASTTQHIIGDAGCYPIVGSRIVSAACVYVVHTISSAPDDHFAARPLYGVKPSSLGRVDGAGGRPTVRVWIVSAAGVKIAVIVVVPTPHDRLAAGPDCGVVGSSCGRVRHVSSCPSVIGWVVPTPSVQKLVVTTISSPHDHFGAGPHCRVKPSGDGRIDSARGGPSVSRWVISTARVEVVVAILENCSTPDDHFAPRPQCGVPVARVGGLNNSSSRPGVVGALRRNSDFRELVMGVVQVCHDTNPVP